MPRRYPSARGTLPGAERPADESSRGANHAGRAPLAHTRTAPRPAVVTRSELKRQERDGIAAALKQTGGKIFGTGGAAELLGMKPTTLASRITALRLNRKTGA